MFKIINKVIKVLVVSDFFFNCGWGLLGPVFAIFLVQNIAIGDAAEGAKIAGFASLVYWIIKSLLQIPIGHHLDKNHGEKDDFLLMFIGMMITGLVPFGYLIASLPWHIYLIQAVYAIAMAMVFPPWLAIFTRHVDKGKEAFEWSLESTAIGLGAGLSGAIGGILASTFGFNVIFIFTGLFSLFSAVMLLIVKKDMFPTVERSTTVPPIVFPF